MYITGTGYDGGLDNLTPEDLDPYPGISASPTSTSCDGISPFVGKLTYGVTDSSYYKTWTFRIEDLEGIDCQSALAAVESGASALAENTYKQTGGEVNLGGWTCSSFSTGGPIALGFWSCFGFSTTVNTGSLSFSVEVEPNP